MDLKFQIHMYFATPKRSVIEINMQAQLLTEIVTGYLVIGHFLYSILYPGGTNSFFQSNIFKVLSGNSLLAGVSKRIYGNMFELVGYFFR